MSTTTNTRKLAELYNLYFELFGVYHPEEGTELFKGLLNFEISLHIKFALRGLKKMCEEIHTEVETLRLGLIDQLGTRSENGIMIPEFELDENGEILLDEAGNKVQTAVWKQFLDEMEKLFQMDVEVPEVKGIEPLDFKGKITTQQFPFFERIAFGVN